MSAIISQPTPSQLMWQYFGWHLWVGLLIWAGWVIPFTFYYHWNDLQLRYDTMSSTKAAYLTNQALQTGFISLMFGLVVAVVSGLVRFPFLKYVACHARSRRELTLKFVFVFIVSIPVIALIPWPIAYNTFSLTMIWNQGRAVLMLSLPWLIATVLAMRKLAAALGLDNQH